MPQSFLNGLSPALGKWREILDAGSACSSKLRFLASLPEERDGYMISVGVCRMSRGTFIGGEGRVHQKHNLFRARSAPIVGMYEFTHSLTSLTLANLLAERPKSGIAFYVLKVECPPKNGGISGGNAFQKSIFRPL